MKKKKQQEKQQKKEKITIKKRGPSLAVLYRFQRLPLYGGLLLLLLVLLGYLSPIFFFFISFIEGFSPTIILYTSSLISLSSLRQAQVRLSKAFYRYCFKEGQGKDKLAIKDLIFNRFLFKFQLSFLEDNRRQFLFLYISQRQFIYFFYIFIFSKQVQRRTSRISR